MRTIWRWRSAAFDLMVAGLVFMLAIAPTVGQLGGRGGSRVLGVIMGVALLPRRRYPLAVMAVVCSLGLLQVLLFPPAADPAAYDVGVVMAMYSVVKYSRARWAPLLAAVPVAIGIVIEVGRHVKPTTGAGEIVRVWTDATVFLAAVCGAVWLTAYTVRTRRLYVLGLEERALTAERERDHLATIAVVEERASIARDLHDVVAHSMAVMIAQADGASYALRTDPEQAAVAIKQVAATGRDALEDMRRLLGVLRGTASTSGPRVDPDPDGTGDRRRIGVDHIGVLVDRARSAGLTVTVEEDGRRDRVPTAVGLTVYRIVQEALTNVLRHAGATTTVNLRLRYAVNQATVEVLDNGHRQAPSGPASAHLPRPRPSHRGGHGLIGMRERVAVHGGTFEASPRLGGGWRVRVEVPWS